MFVKATELRMCLIFVCCVFYLAVHLQDNPFTVSVDGLGLVLWYLTPLSTIFHLYHGG
jgi:hypothetical protein